LIARQKSQQMEHLKKYYAAQADWTRATRNYLYRRANILRAAKILDVGCGTGEITAELLERTKAEVTAVDIDEEAVSQTSERCPQARVIKADAGNLELPDESFDTVVCHFTLMWCADPAKVVSEMARVVKRSGCVIALAEPDYGGLIEYPVSPGYGQIVARGLRLKGANPEIGRKLHEVFSRASLQTNVGLASSVWGPKELEADFDASQWLVSDTALKDEFGKLKTGYEEAFRKDAIVFFLPVFWALGLKN
jgi:ubiquinone/menaquinone biosynthesis C-methylase UbiE